MIHIIVIVFILECTGALSPFSSKSVTDGLGTQIKFYNPKNGEIEMMAAAGVKWVRKGCDWEDVEKTKGVYDFRECDHLFSELEKHKIRPLFLFALNNKLYGNSTAVVTPENRAAFVRYAATTVEYFKGRGIIWEIWNEPDGVFWGEHSNATQYTLMAIETIKAIHAKFPNEVVAGPSVSWFNWNFIEECFKNGLLDHIDAFSIHPYGLTIPEQTESLFHELRHMMSKYSPKGKGMPLISSEWGFSAAWKPDGKTMLGIQDQTKYLPREFLCNIMNNVSISIWYEWIESCTDGANPDCHFGLVGNAYHDGQSPVYTPKPVYTAFKTLVSVLNGYHYVKRIPTNDSNDYILLFSNDHDLRLALWTSSPRPHQITVPFISKDFIDELIDTLGDHLTITITDSPQYLIVHGQNQALLSAPEAHHFKVTVNQIHGVQLSILIENVHQNAFNGVLRLTDVKGIEPSVMESNLQFSDGEIEKTIKFELKSKPANDYSVGMHIEGHGMVLFIPAHRFVTPSENIFKGCKIRADGDSKAKSEQSVNIGPAPEPLSGSNYPVLQVHCHYFEGLKYWEVSPDSKDWNIPDEPKALGMWVYGDDSQVDIRIRVGDSTKQYFQYPLGAPYQKIDWKGWKYLQTNFDNLGGMEHSNGDGTIHYPIFWDTVFLLGIPPSMKKEVNTTIYLTQPVFIY